MQFTTHYIEKLPHFLLYKPLSDLPVRKIHIGCRIPIVRAELDGRFCSVTHIKNSKQKSRIRKNKQKRRITKIGRNREDD